MTFGFAGKAASRGFDLALNVQPINGLRIGANASYNKADHDGAVLTPGNIDFYPSTSAIPATRFWTLTLVGE